MASLANECTVIDRIFRHIDQASTDLSDGIWREPVQHYRSPSRFEAEIERVLRRTPTPFCPSAALTEPGSYVARDAALTPIIAIRGRDGVVRAFRNACRHRGVQLAGSMGSVKALTCRYHGWTYSLEGRLRAIPHEYGFPDVDKEERSLVPVHTVERHGMVFVTQENGTEPGNELAELDGLLPSSLQLVNATEQEFDANWKIVAEGSLEGYHIRSTHRDTFFPIQYDNLNLVESFGRNSRITFPYRRIEKLRSAPAHERRAAGMLTHVYHLFPNVIVATFPTNTLLTVLEPVSVARTRLVTHTLSDQAGHEEGRGAVSQARAFVTAGTDEDRMMTCSAQRSLASGANDSFLFGRFEGAIRHLHRNLDEAIRAGT